MPPRRRPPKRRRSLPRLTARRLALGVLLLVAFLYYRPIMTYFHTRDELRSREVEVQALRAEHRSLSSTFAATTSALNLAVEARRLGFVRQGEQLFVVNGVERWRRAHTRHAR